MKDQKYIWYQRRKRVAEIIKELVLGKHNPWNGQLIRELDISRQTIIVMVKRNGTMLIPKGNLMLMEGDHVILYSQTNIANAEQISI